MRSLTISSPCLLLITHLNMTLSPQVGCFPLYLFLPVSAKWNSTFLPKPSPVRLQKCRFLLFPARTEQGKEEGGRSQDLLRASAQPSQSSSDYSGGSEGIQMGNHVLKVSAFSRSLPALPAWEMTGRGTECAEGRAGGPRAPIASGWSTRCMKATGLMIYFIILPF